MIPAVPLILRGILGVTALLVAMLVGILGDTLDAVARWLDTFAHWLVPEVGAEPLEKRRREP
ncbi:hypothetical protein [Aureimonas psammosilenae]|uniref:hypothetical protein n=1 Tax=Aureimonas psammosilenae TaxID=2495496 RepID=UPI001260DB41|nr:hypothetical protein [Aureimonas psammosilenae]